MTFTQILKAAFLHIPHLKFVSKADFSKVITILLGATLLLAIPTTLQVIDIFRDVQADSQEIAQTIPDFTIVDGQLHTADDAEGFIYQTNSIIFTFDPQGKRNAADIAADVTGSTIAVGLLKDQLIIHMPASGLSNSLLDSNQLDFDYSEPALKNINGTAIREALSNRSIPWLIKIVVFIVALYPTFLNLLITLLMGTFIATIYTKLKLFPFTFFENLKILIVSAALPSLMSVFVQLILPSFDSSTFILFASLFLFTQGVKNTPKLDMNH
ncbi:DUF1189 family protein [Enterococcus sp. DIV0876]|uniref:DUF1189 family protein n=1 Tax=Enterococcus sp. DIV0876 TaxID=2774633 RepID=UPI003D2FA39E